MSQQCIQRKGRFCSSCLGSLLVGIMMVTPLWAGTLYWGGGTVDITGSGIPTDGSYTTINGTWSTAISNWWNGVAWVAWPGDDPSTTTASFGNSGAGNTTIMLGTDIRANQLIYGPNNASRTLTLSAATTKTLTLSGMNPCFIVTNTAGLNAGICLGDKVSFAGTNGFTTRMTPGSGYSRGTYITAGGKTHPISGKATVDIGAFVLSDASAQLLGISSWDVNAGDFCGDNAFLQLKYGSSLNQIADDAVINLNNGGGLYMMVADWQSGTELVGQVNIYGAGAMGCPEYNGNLGITLLRMGTGGMDGLVRKEDTSTLAIFTAIGTRTAVGVNQHSFGQAGQDTAMLPWMMGGTAEPLFIRADGIISPFPATLFSTSATLPSDANTSVRIYHDSSNATAQVYTFDFGAVTDPAVKSLTASLPPTTNLCAQTANVTWTGTLTVAGGLIGETSHHVYEYQSGRLVMKGERLTSSYQPGASCQLYLSAMNPSGANSPGLQMTTRITDNGATPLDVIVTHWGAHVVIFDGTNANTYSGTTTVEGMTQGFSTLPGDAYGMQLNKTLGAVAIPGNLIIRRGGVVRLVASGAGDRNQIADTSDVVVDGTLALRYGDTIHGLSGSGKVLGNLAVTGGVIQPNNADKALTIEKFSTYGDTLTAGAGALFRFSLGETGTNAKLVFLGGAKLVTNAGGHILAIDGVDGIKAGAYTLMEFYDASGALSDAGKPAVSAFTLNMPDGMIGHLDGAQAGKIRLILPPRGTVILLQ